MGIGEHPCTDVGADAVQVVDGLLAGEFVDVIAQDQDVDAGVHGAVSHGGAPPDNGDRRKGNYTAPRPDGEQRLTTTSALPVTFRRGGWIMGGRDSCPT